MYVCAAGGRVIGLSVSQSVRPSGLSSEGLVEGLFQDRRVRIQKIQARRACCMNNRW